MTPSPVIKVVIVDDNVKVRRALAAILEQEEDIKVVGFSKTGIEGIHEAERHKPDVILMDLSMPVMDGIKATALLHTILPDPRVIVVSQFDQDEYVRRAVASGAKGYLLKQSLVDELAEAIRTVHEGSEFFTPPISARLERIRSDNPPSGMSEEEGTVL